MKKCHDCGVSEGEYHIPGCDWERCPICSLQLLSCGCSEEFYKKNFSQEWKVERFNRISKGVLIDVDCELEFYEDNYSQKWEEELRKVGLVPYGKENHCSLSKGGRTYQCSSVVEIGEILFGGKRV